MKGEDCGQEISPDQFHQDLRKKLTTKEYVTSQQIRGNFKLLELKIYFIIVFNMSGCGGWFERYLLLHYSRKKSV